MSTVENPLTPVSWTCPFCGIEKQCYAHGEDPIAKGRRSMKVHVRALSDNVHGDWKEIPEELPDGVLNEHVRV